MQIRTRFIDLIQIQDVRTLISIFLPSEYIWKKTIDFETYFELNPGKTQLELPNLICQRSFGLHSLHCLTKPTDVPKSSLQKKTMSRKAKRISFPHSATYILASNCLLMTRSQTTNQRIDCIMKLWPIPSLIGLNLTKNTDITRMNSAINFDRCYLKRYIQSDINNVEVGKTK